MAKKRGGLAGLWDRNKKLIKPVATGLAGLLGTPALGAAVGAAMGGLDRPGKSGVGVDVGGALKGGVSGYAAGKLGHALPGVLSGGKVGPVLGAPGSGATDVANAASGGGGNPLASLLGLLGGSGGASGLLGKAGDFLTGNKGLNALGVAQGVNAAALGKQSTDYAKSALAKANAAYDAKAPLRATGIANMTQTLGRPAPSTSPLAQIAARNPFAARS